MNTTKLNIIGERINPGFKSSKSLFDNSDLEGIQALAVRQAEAGASYINVNIGTRALNDTPFMVDAIQAIQSVISVPLSFDFPSIDVQRVCLNAYDDEKARGEKPIVNSVSEPREEMLELMGERPFKLIVMASERMEGGAGKANKFASEVHDVTSRMAEKITSHKDFSNSDIIVDVSISTLASDTEGLIKMALDAVKLINEDPALKGIHMMGGLSNIGQMLPPKTIEGMDIKNAIERAFLTMAMPNGFDTLLATPWHNHELLPEDSAVLAAFKEIVELRGSDAMRAMRKLYKA